MTGLPPAENGSSRDRIRKRLKVRNGGVAIDDERTLHDPTCTTLDHALALRFALGLDTYVLPYARVGLSASATAEFSEGYTCNLMILFGPQPPNPPPPAVFVLGLNGTLGFPARARSTATPGDAR